MVVYGTQGNVLPWLEVCRDLCFIPHALFRVSPYYMVGVRLDNSYLFMRRVGKNPIEFTFDYKLFRSNLRTRAEHALAEYLSDPTLPIRKVEMPTKVPAHACHNTLSGENVSPPTHTP